MISMNPAKQVLILKSILKEYGQWVSNSLTAAPNGLNIARSDNETTKDYSDRAWFHQVMQGNISSDMVVSRTHGRPSWVLAVPIQDSQKKIVGGLSMISFVSSISDIVGNDKIGKTGYSFIISDKGKVVAHPKKELTNSMADFSKHAVLSDLGSSAKKKITFIDTKTEQQTIAYTQRTKFNWIVITQQDYDEAYAPLTAIKRQLVILFTVTLLAIALVAWLITRKWQSVPEEKQSKYKFFLQLTLTVVTLNITVLGINWLSHHRYFSNHITQYIDDQLNIRSDALTRYVDMWFDMNIRLIRQNTALSDIQSMDAAKQLPILKSIGKEYPWAWVRSMRPDGQDLARSDNEKLKNYADRNYFQTAMQGKLGSEILIGKTTGQPTLVLSLPIFNDEQKIIGIFTMSSVISNLSEAIANIKVAKSGYAYLLDNTGKLIAHAKKPFTKALLDFSKLPPYTSVASVTKNKVSYTDEPTRKNIISYAQKNKLGWVVVVEREINEGHGVIAAVNFHSFLILLISFLLIFPAAWYLSRRI